VPIHLLYNTTITIKAVALGLSGNQRVQTHGSAGNSIPARIEHIDDSITPVDIGEVVQRLFLIYVPAGTTVKDGDIVTDNADSSTYKVISTIDAYAMKVIDHKELTVIKQ